MSKKFANKCYIWMSLTKFALCYVTYYWNILLFRYDCTSELELCHEIANCALWAKSMKICMSLPCPIYRNSEVEGKPKMTLTHFFPTKLTPCYVRIDFVSLSCKFCWNIVIIPSIIECVCIDQKLLYNIGNFCKDCRIFYWKSVV